MAFGLMTGSYAKNTSGGVLRKNIASLKDEINLDNGQMSNSVGVIKALDKLKITGFGSSHAYNENCSVPEVGGPLAQGRCRMWGNPIAEIMYEGLRYLGGETAATSAFDIDSSGNDDATLGLPLPTWLNPYRGKADGGYPTCSKPSQIVISDISPNFDTDQLPGRYEYTAPAALTAFSGTSSLNSNTLSVSSLGGTIWTGEFGSSTTKSFFIGQSENSFDGAPTAKNAYSFASMRGLAPEEPSQQGGFFAASIAHFGKVNDINSAAGDQKVDTYSVALASPKPRIEFPIDGKTITLVPFGKTVGGCGSITATKGYYQPTNTIVDFYILAFNNTNAGNQDASVNSGRPYAKFRINYEDSEYGSDHDMDAIVEYELTATATKTLEVKLKSDYAAGGCIQHMGYVISGTTADGTYLDVRDSDTGSGTDIDYFLDTPNDTDDLPLENTRTFTPGTTSSAQFVPHDPLWYAAKWGGFVDKNDNNLPDLDLEWDSNGDSDKKHTPDTYFLVQNPLKLKEALRRAFDTIIDRTGSAGNVTANSTSLSTTSQVFQSLFNTKSWSGNLKAFSVSDEGVGSVPNWQAALKLPAHDARHIFTVSAGVPIEFLWSDELSSSDKAALGSENVLNFLRGDRSKELQNGGTLRDRTTHVLGDIVHSSPSYAKDSDTVFVGSNDGMLHAFDATIGSELFAYIPSQALPRLKKLSQINYGSDINPHQYFVDGDIAVSSTAQTSGHNYLISTLGQGGKGLFGLDVTTPDSFGVSNVLWEYFNASDLDLGYMLGRPVIAKMNGGDMAVIVGNGYNSGSGKAVLYIFNLTTGDIIKKIDTGVAGDNGLASPGVFDSDKDGDIDVIYAGDLKGNVWKFDVSQNNTTQWDVAFKSGTTPEPLFIAKDADGDRQPITAQITATVNPNAVAKDPNGGKRFLHFGTGSYFRVADPNDHQVQTWYGLIDEDLKIADHRSDSDIDKDSGVLKQRTVLAEGTFSYTVKVSETETKTVTIPVRTFSEAITSTTNDMTGKKGWYIDLTKADGTAEGERIVTSSRVYQLAEPTLIASSIIPVVDPCLAGGRGYVNAINPFSGARLTLGFFDVNRNNDFTDDKLNDIPIGSVDLGVDMPGEPVLVDNILVVCGSSGVCSDIPVNWGIVAKKGRISWREIVQD